MKVIGSEVRRKRSRDLPSQYRVNRTDASHRRQHPKATYATFRVSIFWKLLWFEIRLWRFAAAKIT